MADACPFKVGDVVRYRHGGTGITGIAAVFIVELLPQPTGEIFMRGHFYEVSDARWVGPVVINPGIYERHPDPDPILASFAAWRLVKGD